MTTLRPVSKTRMMSSIVTAARLLESGVLNALGICNSTASFCARRICLNKVMTG
jgi:hypothetical protein